MDAYQIYTGKDGEKTRALYALLQTLGPQGEIAMNLFRAHKCSSRAKVYRSKRFVDDAYSRKAWSLGLLADKLKEHSNALGIVWGWKIDPEQPHYPWVLYVDLPTGQVSFHMRERIANQPDYPGEWDGSRLSAERIIRWTQALLNARDVK